jgi:response regulator RpfG family c-di-GMP phosphodiesterase
MKKPVIICIDDDDLVLLSLEFQLKDHFEDKYTIELAEDAKEGFEIIEELNSSKVEILVIISDWLMPGMRGDEFLCRVHEKFPHIVKLMLTGQADQKAIQNAVKNANLIHCFSKPWNRNELFEVIEKGIADNKANLE